MHDSSAAPFEDRSIIYQPGRAGDGAATPTQAGPYLLLDEQWIAKSSDLERVVVQPQRDPGIPNPIVTSPADRCYQPYMSVLPDPEAGRWRIWYGASREDRVPGRSHLATMDSDDGVNFVRPHTLCETPEIQFGSNVIDRGPDHDDAATRYVYSYWFDGGTRFLASADGLCWRPLVEGIVLRHNHDITGIDWDPVRQVYIATLSVYITSEQWSGQRRTTMMSSSHDLVHWDEPWYVLVADGELDEGETQFYAMSGYLARGPVKVAMVKVLRDDLQAAGTEPGSFGRAHTSLAWSYDGRTWVRDRAKFFEPDDDPDAWDHAHTWIDEQVVVGDRVRLYYGGYKQGHKMGRFEERQIGLVEMPLDRYVARRADGRTPGWLTTTPIELPQRPGALQVNANAAAGCLRVQVRDAATGEVTLGLDDCDPIAADGLHLPMRWRGGDLLAAAGQTVQLEFELTAADLFAFEFR